MGRMRHPNLVSFLALCPLPPAPSQVGLVAALLQFAHAAPFLWQVWPTWACSAVRAVRCWVAESTAVFGRRAAQ